MWAGNRILYTYTHIHTYVFVCVCVCGWKEARSAPSPKKGQVEAMVVGKGRAHSSFCVPEHPCNGDNQQIFRSISV